MRDVFNEHKQKIFSTLLVTTGALLGFEAISYIVGIYQLNTAVYVAFYVYLFHIFWLTFIFDLHLKKRGVLANAKLNYKGAKMVRQALKDRLEHVRRWEYLRHYQNYLVLPGMIYWATIILLFLNPFNFSLKLLIVLLATFAMSVAYWYMKEHVSRRLEAQNHWIRVLSVVKLFAAFLIYSAIVGVAFHFGYNSTFVFLSTVTVTFLLVYQALFQHHLLNFEIFLWIVITSLALGLVSLWVYANWNTQYFTAGLVMLSVYNTLWGILHHYLDKTLTRKVVFEYIVMMIFIVSLLFASHNFNQRVI